MARSVEGSSRSAASVEKVWAVWTNPASWPGGPVEAAELHRTFEVGSTYTTKLKGYSSGCMQRYVSKELSHFAGRGKAEDEQYDVLVSILRGGVLRHSGRVSCSRGASTVNSGTPSDGSTDAPRLEPNRAQGGALTQNR